MKKAFRIALLIVIVFALAAVNAPSTVQAIHEPNTSIAAGTWSTGTEAAINLDETPAPSGWLQLLANGVKVTEPGKICHEFRGGQFGWVADVRQWVDGQWVTVETTQGWLNGQEAPYMVCAQAPAAGTYALFGYYVQPKNVIKSLPECEGVEFGGTIWNQEFEGGYKGIRLSLFPEEMASGGFRYKVLSYTAAPWESDVTLTHGSGSFAIISGYFMGYPEYTGVLSDMWVRIYTSTCYYDVEMIWS